MSDTQATVLSYVISLALMFAYVVRIEIRRRRVAKVAALGRAQSPANKKAEMVSELKLTSKIKAS